MGVEVCRAVFVSLSGGKASAAAGTSSDGAEAAQSVVARGQNVRLRPKSVVAEAYRTIRTAVFFGVPKGQAKSILVTSPAPGDGKSTLVSNLAIAMAQAGQRTLVIDCDFRRPMQHKIFEVGCEKGLSSVLSGSGNPDESIQAGPVSGLDLLSCGPEVPNPSELLNSDLFVAVLNRLCEEYDRVIIDSPPVTPVADSQILGAVCDITLLVLRAEKSTRKLSQQARDSLLSVGGHLLGAIVNDVSRRRGHYGYGRYGYYAGYGYYGHYGYYGRKESKRQHDYIVS
jgi:capsular exopolysaccharide synthesis family protein